ncbi:MAG: ATP-dependent DNA helicase RecQ [Lachnospiraceae bacterium]|nr:ATP-dependent DNA helicase RecQ [Lachnospiraceae bacterium]
MDPLLSALQSRFGLPSFRPGQHELISSILAGRDVLGVLPTGTGKSLCYQLPACLLPGLTLVISPLIALMKDQVSSCIRRGLPAAALYASQPFAEQKQILREAAALRIRLLYVSPERLQSAGFRQALSALPVSLLAIDEAHCISAWGHDFRPAYLEIPDFTALLRKRPVIAAFTATASPEVRRDILQHTGLQHPFCLTTGFDRRNLFYEVRHVRDKRTSLLSLLKQYAGYTGIVYCLTRRTVDAVTRFLNGKHLSAVPYHAGMTDEARAKAQDAWLSGSVPVIVATNAFGMGIDKPDVRYVIHYNMPASPEAYYQEAGRAGRDGLPSDCILLYSPRDVTICRFFIAGAHAPALKEHMEYQLSAMRRYCTGDTCLRATLLQYFGEHALPFCGKCSVCLKTGPFPSPQKPGIEDHTLYRSLIGVRKRISERTGRQPYRILSDRNLHDLAVRRPLKFSEMAAIEDIGLLKTIQYGADFLKEIRAGQSRI